MPQATRVLFGMALLVAGLGLASHGQQLSAIDSRDDAVSQSEGFPPAGVVPKDETGATRFLAEHPEYDGRGTIVAIFDTGVDAAARGLMTTPQGQAKFIDFIDATGSGDVDMTSKAKVEGGRLKGKTGRDLTPAADWKNPTGEFRLGMAFAFDLFPAEDLVARLETKRRDDWEQRRRDLQNTVQAQIDAVKADSTPSKAELEARLKALNEANFDVGPVYDCVSFHDGQRWRAVVDTDEDGDLAEEKLLTDYHLEPGYDTFDDESLMNFTVHFYDNGDTLSIVVPSGDHGTHVAGIVGAYESARPERNGLAPGCQMISVKIGDTRLGGMETGAGLIRGLKSVLDHKCDLVNMSYGEPATLADKGRIQELMNELVREHGVIFVSSAGNAGPALSTVGAPGGTSSGIIGVGAYVSPEMMDVEYTTLEQRAGTAYTWTSRGPALDGDWGVDIFAPGGAITAVPPYTLQPIRQMNGTSMASPNACGNIALLLSGMKQQKLSYTNWSVLRAIQNTANIVAAADRFAQGAGLLQVDKAFQHLMQWHDAAGEQEELQVSLPGQARGIYLREASVTDQPFQATVSVTPRFPDSSTSADQLDYELELRWSCSEDWVQVGEHMVLLSGGNRMPVRVQPQLLPEGVHVTEVVAHDVHHPERGPLVRIPVTVIKGTTPYSNKLTWSAGTDGGDIVRKFVHAPDGATWAEVKIERNDTGVPILGYLHCVELVPGQTFEEGESVNMLALEPESERTLQIPVTGGRTLEICWAHYWSSQARAHLSFELEFRGLSTRDNTLSLPSDGSTIRVDVRSAVARESFAPSASLTTLRRILAPVSSGKATPLPGDRDALWDGRRTHVRRLTYQFTLDEEAEVTLHCPELEGLLYDSPVDHFLMTLKNAHGRVVLTEDIYAESPPQHLASGEYSVELELRHLDPKALGAWGNTLLAVDQELSSPIGLKVYETRVAATGAGGRAVAEKSLPPETETAIWFRFSEDAKVPAAARGGDMLTGQVTLTADPPETGHGGDTFSVTYTVPAQAPSSDSSKASSEDFEQASLDFLLKHLSECTWPRDKELVERISAEYNSKKANDRKLAVARLHLIDNDEPEDHLADVVTAADAVIQSIDQNELQSYFGVRRDPESSEEKEIDSQRTSTKNDLIDALYRKSRALAHMELAEVVARHPLTDPAAHDKLFTSTLTELGKWADLTAKKYSLLMVRKHWRKGDFGQALNLLNENFNREESEYMHDKKRSELYQLLGWTEWREAQSRYMLRRYPGGEE